MCDGKRRYDFNRAKKENFFDVVLFPRIEYLLISFFIKCAKI